MSFTRYMHVGSTQTKYFVSGGFAFVHSDSTTDISAVEAVKLEDLDGDVCYCRM